MPDALLSAGDTVTSQTVPSAQSQGLRRSVREMV